MGLDGIHKEKDGKSPLLKSQPFSPGSDAELFMSRT